MTEFEFVVIEFLLFLFATIDDDDGLIVLGLIYYLVFSAELPVSTKGVIEFVVKFAVNFTIALKIFDKFMELREILVKK